MNFSNLKTFYLENFEVYNKTFRLPLKLFYFRSIDFADFLA